MEEVGIRGVVSKEIPASLSSKGDNRDGEASSVKSMHQRGRAGSEIECKWRV